MAPVRSIQPSFTGGEFAPSLYGRVDLQKYATGLKKATNFFIHPHGSASNRPGTKYIASVKDSTKRVRLVPFEFSFTQSYVIEFGDGYCRFYKDGGQIAKSSADAWLTVTAYVVGDYITNGGTMYYCLVAHTSGTFATDLAANKWVAQTIYEIPTPYAEADLTNLKFAQSADTLYICHPDHASLTLLRFSHDDWDLVTYVNKGGPFMLSNTTAKTLTMSHTTGTGRTLTASAATFDALHVGSLWRLVHEVPGSSVTVSYTASNQSSSIKCGSIWRIVTRGTWTGKITVEKSTNGGATWTIIRSFYSAGDVNHNTFGEVDEPCLIRIDYVHTSGTALADLSADPFTQTGIVKVTGFTNGTTVTADVLRDVGATAPTTDWAEGSWSDYRGYPACVTFFQDRLTFAATKTEPQTIWMTESGNYTSFARNEPLLDSDGITINLPSRKLNGIKSLAGLQSLVALTSASEWTIAPAVGTGVITPAAVETKEYGQRGSNGVDPVVVGNRLIFVQPHGSVVRDLGFEEEVLGLAGIDLSILSNHLFTGYSIVALAYQQEPDSLVWAVRDDGALLSMTYMREHEVIAWTPHETDGDVESICTIPGEDYDELWLAVKRGSSRFVERMVRRMTSTDPRDQFFMDAGLSLDSPKTITGATKANPVVVTCVAHGFSNGDVVSILDVEGMTELNGRKFIVSNKTTDTFELKDEDGVNVNGTDYGTYAAGGEVRAVVSSLGGLSHLNGKTVTILADGSVQPSQAVSGGSITLSPAAAIVHVGLPYTAAFQTLKPEIPLRDGTTQGRKVRVVEVILRFLNSRGGYVGPDDDEDNLRDIVQRTNEPMGSPVELKTQDYPISIPPSWEDGGQMYYEQRDPLPVTILAVIKQLGIGE
jgi:hypothetical protein